MNDVRDRLSGDMSALLQEAATKLGRSLAVRDAYARIVAEHEHVPSYHALFDAFRRAGDLDPAFCVASVLEMTFLATPEQEAFVEQHRADGWTAPSGHLDEAQLVRHVLHPDQDLVLTELFGLLAPAVANWRALALPPALRALLPVDFETDRSAPARILVAIQRALGFHRPAVVRAVDAPLACSVLNVRHEQRLRPTLVWGRELLRGSTDVIVAWELARAMLDLWHPHFCLVALERSVRALEQVVTACMVREGLPASRDTPWDIPTLELISREIALRMDEAARLRLSELVRRLVAREEPVDVRRWVAATELTANRMGLVMCGDIRVAAAAASEQKLSVPTEVQPPQLIEELALYGMSEDYFAARKALGLDVREA